MPGTTRRRGRRGITLPWVATMLVALIGTSSLTVDVAHLYVRKQQHVNGCDAGALAGAWELPDRVAAEEHARRAAGANGLAGDVAVFVEFPAEDEIVVWSEQPVPLGLARIFGRQQSIVRARAKAITAIPNVLRDNTPAGLRPWGIDVEQDLDFGNQFTLKIGSRDSQGEMTVSGNYFAVRLTDVPGANAYRDLIYHGATGDWEVGTLLDTEPGNMMGPTINGVNYLLTQAQQEPWGSQTWETATLDNPRVVILPIVNWETAGGGMTQVELLGFAAFYIESIRGQDVVGRFLLEIPIQNADLNPGAPDPVDGGVRTVKLIE